jgi:hypothetical protein
MLLLVTGRREEPKLQSFVLPQLGYKTWGKKNIKKLKNC